MAGITYDRRRDGDLAAADLDAEVARIAAMTIDELRTLWRQRRGKKAPASLPKILIARALIHEVQEACLGGLDPHVRKLLAGSTTSSGRSGRHLKIGSVIVREYQGHVHEVMVVPDGFRWRGQSFSSLSTIAREITGTSWNGPRFFGLRDTGLRGADVKPARCRAGAQAPIAVAKASIKARTGDMTEVRSAVRSARVVSGDDNAAWSPVP